MKKTLRDKKTPRSDATDQLLGLRLSHLRHQIRTLLAELEALNNESSKMDRGIDLRAQVRQFEIDIIRSALRLTNGNQKLAASMLQVNPTTLSAKIKLYRINREG
jgi:DNA-binding NtrC family response regulator